MFLLLVIAVAGFAVYSEQKYRALSDALDVHIATYKRQRWTRDPLRGPAGEENAALAARDVLATLSALEPEQRDGLANQLYYGQPLPPALAKLVQEHAEQLAQLRAATQNGWAMTAIDVEHGARANLPNYPRLMDAALLLLAEAMERSADDCLPEALDTIRLGQDQVPGAPLEAASVAMRIASEASRVIPRCASRASPQALILAAREMHVLAAHPPPVGPSIELGEVAAMVKLRELGQLVGAQDDTDPLTRLRRRPILYQAFAVFDRPTRFRELSPTHYPSTLDRWRSEQEFRARSGLPLVAETGANVIGWLFDDMRGQALLRAMTVGLATVSERARHDKLPREPVGLGDPALRDPFNGQPLKWRLAQDGSELTIWSVGEDLRDDRGSSEWAQKAPLDVVVHFPLADKPRVKARKPLRARRHHR